METSSQTQKKSLLSIWPILGFCTIAISTVIFVTMNATVHMAAATISFSVLSLGLILRQNKKVHPYFMITAILMDLGLVLALEIQRNAIATAASFTLSPLQQAHIGASSIATLLYFPVLYLGFMRWKNKLTSNASRTWHIRLGMAAFLFRAMGFILMFTLLSYVKKA